MKNCIDCKHAQWDRTMSGHLHPSGAGRCGYEYKLPPLPAARRWIGGEPMASSGHINRRRELDKHCPYFARKE